jgi:hypothetical protein
MSHLRRIMDIINRVQCGVKPGVSLFGDVNEVYAILGKY